MLFRFLKIKIEEKAGKTLTLVLLRWRMRRNWLGDKNRLIVILLMYLTLGVFFHYKVNMD